LQHFKLSSCGCFSQFRSNIYGPDQCILADRRSLLAQGLIQVRAKIFRALQPD
jgi:hypothetical protein